MPTNPRTGKKHKHEDYSAALVRHLMRDVVDRHPANELKISTDEICDFSKTTAAFLFSSCSGAR